MSRDSYTPSSVALPGAGAPAMRVRELRVTDVRCRSDGCGAGPGQPCNQATMGVTFGKWVAVSATSYDGVNAGVAHCYRVNDYNELVYAGWQWQEVDPTDRGKKEG